jgi:hypothetical protein
MKKSILMLGIVSILTAGTAFGADIQTVPATDNRLFNGVTYFNLGDTNKVQQTIQADEIVSLNGVTVFNLAKAGDRRARTMPDAERIAKYFNGVTMF